MNPARKLTLFNDPIYGFITIPDPLIFLLIEHRFFQRLRRISQMGLSYLVFPGAHHTRFHHALGSMYLMQRAVRVLRYKNVDISNEEEKALYAAILLHDIGHGPFSHAMEHSIVSGLNHEDISLIFMKHINEEMNHELDLAIAIFKGDYHRKFLHQMVSGQLDMDRADYLKRDSFYTGVPEGNVNSERLISMMHVVDDQLVIEEKGVYSIEKFLTARRLMYWQIYLHKTSLVAEQLMIRALQRAKSLVQGGTYLSGSKALQFFLKNNISQNDFDESTLNIYAQLDDYDIISALKDWQNQDDFVLKELSRMIINRDLLKIKIKNKKIKGERLQKYIEQVKNEYQLTDEEARYFVFTGEISNQAYDKKKEAINILMENGKISEITDTSNHLHLKVLAKPVTKFYICFPKPKL
ncbi:MAG: HD domain-containing protein [Flavobacteriaceae bacterium]|nr:HD domain-containing protein [Bacteroidia bacterium]MBT8287876.1 HD domain-containing protein [Bacteroidia bacterium]NNF74579.1 HD domain-containing protein [Flavobacteriaceae bacterium]NNK74157.1 HD domain-containing protein [Flavobacteriaceae bacterium]